MRKLTRRIIRRGLWIILIAITRRLIKLEASKLTLIMWGIKRLYRLYIRRSTPSPPPPPLSHRAPESESRWR